MKTKIIMFIACSVCFSFMIQGMDDPTPSPNSQTVVQISDDSVSVTTTTTAPERKKSPVPHIVLASQSSSSRHQIRKRVESTKDLKEHIKKNQNTQRTARDSPPLARAMPQLPTDTDDHEPGFAPLSDDPSLRRRRDKKSFLPEMLTQLTGQPIDNKRHKTYTEKEVWELVAACNPVLYEFGKKHTLELEDLEIFAACIEELDINPKLITEYIHRTTHQQIGKNRFHRVIDYVLGDPYAQHLDGLHKEYEKMQREKPEDYKAMLLELMKTMADQTEGQQTPRSTIADIHTSLQTQSIAEKERDRRLAYFVATVSLVTAIGGWAFGLVGQFSSSNNHSS